MARKRLEEVGSSFLSVLKSRNISVAEGIPGLQCDCKVVQFEDISPFKLEYAYKDAHME